jgi:S-DNA-T family DNA segregation ATPase FtsK/SpoIIIE
VLKNRDELYESAVDVVVREGRGSVSLLQRALGIGYGRAAG